MLMAISYSFFFMISDSTCPARLSVNDDGLLGEMPATVISWSSETRKLERNLFNEPRHFTFFFRCAEPINKIVLAGFMALMLYMCV